MVLKSPGSSSVQVSTPSVLRGVSIRGHALAVVVGAVVVVVVVVGAACGAG
jgi:hypothetical protein